MLCPLFKHLERRVKNCCDERNRSPDIGLSQRGNRLVSEHNAAVTGYRPDGNDPMGTKGVL